MDRRSFIKLNEVEHIIRKHWSVKVIKENNIMPIDVIKKLTYIIYKDVGGAFSKESIEDEISGTVYSYFRINNLPMRYFRNPKKIRFVNRFKPTLV